MFKDAIMHMMGLRILPKLLPGKAWFWGKALEQVLPEGRANPAEERAVVLSQDI